MFCTSKFYNVDAYIIKLKTKAHFVVFGDYVDLTVDVSLACTFKFFKHGLKCFYNLCFPIAKAC